MAVNDNQKRNLDAVSRIDDDIIEKQTKKRVSLLQGGKRRPTQKKKWYIAGGSIAAALLLVLGTVLLLVNLLSKQVPVYTGMTVSNDAPTAKLSEGSFTVLELNAEGNNGNHYGHYKGDCAGDQTVPDEPFPDKPLKDSLVVVGAAEERYYAKSGEDIYITVHIDNPDSFEILSFTLNGEKYSSYMFEAGSDLENLILKVNVGETEGVVDYTIDAIKYVDGTEIKDVRMEGDKTVNVGVYTDKQPTAAISAVTAGFNSIGFTVSGTDEMGLIADSNGKVEAILYDGDTVIARKDVSLASGTAVTFDGLKPNTLYQYAIVATYDALDGKGFSEYILSEQAIYTEAPMLFDSVVLTTTSVSFDFLRHTNADGATIESIVLSDGTATQNLGVSATSKEGLLPNTAYTLTVTYRNGDRTETITLEFTTAPLTYTVTHQLEKLDGTYETVETVTEVIGLGEILSVPVQTHTGFTSPTAQSITGALGESLTVTYQYPRAEYAVTLVCNDGTAPIESLKYGAALPSATRDGFVFGGWFTDAECTTPITTVPAEPIAVYAQWVEETLVSALSYTIDNKGITINGLKADLASLVIPSYIGGVPVSSIAPNAFAGRAQITSVRLPDTLAEIGSGALRGCTGITELTIPESVTGIGNYAFEGMKKLTRINFNAINITSANTTADMFSGAGSESSGITVVFGAKVKAVPVNLFAHDGAEGKSSPNIKTVTFAEGSVCVDINGWAFLNCTTLQSITLPPSLKVIYSHAFYNTSLTSVVLPAGVTDLKTYAFAGCTQLLTVTLSEGLVNIGANAFDGCAALTELTIPANVKNINAGAFADCTALTKIYFNAKAMNTLTVDTFSAAGAAGDGIAVVFGAEVTVVPVNLFAHEGAEGQSSPNIKTVTFAEESVCTDINGAAFKNCTTLQSITLPPSLQKILIYAFYKTGLTAVELPAGVNRINDYAFAECAQLSTLSFETGSELSNIGTDIFANAPIVTATVPAVAISRIPKAALENITILDGSYISEGAFSGAAKLKTVTLPDSMTRMYRDAFKDCAVLTDVYFGGSLAQWFAVAFTNEEANPCRYADHLWIDETDALLMEELLLAKDFAGFGANALMGFENLDRVNYEGTLADWCAISFANAASNPLSLTGALYIDGVNVTEGVVTVPAGVTSIGAYAFCGCTGITELVIPANVTTVGFAALDGCVALQTLTVPFVGEKEDPSGNDAVYYPFGYLFGTTAREGTTATTQSYLKYTGGNSSTVNGTYYVPDSLRTVTVLGGSRVVRGAFQNCKYVTSVTLPQDISNLQPNAFRGSGITSISLPATVTGIYSSAFEGCTALQSITIPANVTQISQNAFKDCTSLTTVTFVTGSKLSTVGENVFANAPIVKATVSCMAISSIPTAALESITILDGKYLDKDAFKNATKLKTVILPDTLQTINENVFLNCTAITEITIPANVTTIKAAAFEGCTALTKIYFNAKAMSSLVADTFSAAGTAGDGIAVVFGAEVTKVPENLFAHDGAEGKSAPKIVSVTFASGSVCKHINGSAFKNCTSLQSISLPSGLQIIYGYAFYNTSLNAVELPASVTELKSNVFAKCTKLSTVTLSESLTTIGNNCFDGCTALETLKILAKVTQIKSNTFLDCAALTDVYFAGTQTQWKGISFGNEYANPCKYAKHLWIDGVDVMATT